MPGVARLNGFLASTAVALLLSAGTSGAFAQTTPAPATDGALPVLGGPSKPTTAATSPAASDPAATPTPSATQPDAPAASAAPSTEPASAPPSVGSTETPTAPAAAAPAPAAPASADAAITDKLRELTGGKFDRVLGGKTERSAIEAFYTGRSFAPLWFTDGQENARAKATIDYLGHVDADGLEPNDYPVPKFEGVTDPDALAEAELRLTASVLAYSRHASIGRVAWSRVSGDISYDQKAPEPAVVLAAIAEASDAATVLDSYEPHAKDYLALKAKLAELRTGKDTGGKTQPIKSGPVLKVGSQDDRVPLLRERLGVSGDGSTVYDKALAEAIKKFQKEHELKVTGTLTAPTVDAMNGPRPAHEVETVIANLERWRWMPHDLGNTYVIVNLPDYTLRVMHDGQQLWKTKIVIGKPGMPTPIMSAEMKYITVNPTWNVPPSIVNNEYLPAMQQDPSVMERMGLKVSHNPDGTVHISQPPGDKNALGRIRFNFPNKFLVYQHDTPDKFMFAYAKRAFSHGCMRVFDPPKYAEVLLGLVRPTDGYTAERLKKMYGPSEVNIEFPKFIPVNLTYQTAFVDDEGKLEFREDVYGRDRQLLAILNGRERAVADVPVEHRIDIKHRQVLAVPDWPGLWGNSNFNNSSPNANPGGGFFARLFGGGFNAPQRPVAAKPVRRHTVRARERSVAQ